MKGRSLLEQGLCWQVRCGMAIKCKETPWISNYYLFLPKIRDGAPSEIQWVCQLLEPSFGSWNEHLVRKLFFHDDANETLSMLTSIVGGNDRILGIIIPQGYTMSNLLLEKGLPVGAALNRRFQYLDDPALNDFVVGFEEYGHYPLWH
ncbi:conserved hypothetical protein [Ricinus communis]|uniref:Uncharacterized protein n=1 Tax=Ricinus communis TaxID=3988 RepID=B9SAJ2_RICCO|nr:conserved hypothetical protein [Ricinus communis]